MKNLRFSKVREPVVRKLQQLLRSRNRELILSEFSTKSTDMNKEEKKIDKVIKEETGITQASPALSIINAGDIATEENVGNPSLTLSIQNAGDIATQEAFGIPTVTLTREEKRTLQRLKEWLNDNIKNLEFDSITIGFPSGISITFKKKK